MTRNVIETAHTDRRETLGVSCDYHNHDCSEYSNTTDELGRRDALTEKKADTPAKPQKGSKTEQPEPTKTTKSWIPNWSYHKSSIAAASIFTAITAAAIIFLVVLWIRKLRERRKRDKRKRHSRGSNTDSAKEKKRKRESLMFSKNSSRTYLVEHTNGSVIRVLCTSNHALPYTSTLDAIGTSLVQTSSSSLITKSDAARHLEILNASQEGRSGSIPQPIVIVPPALEPVVSRSADPDMQPEEATLSPIPETASICRDELMEIVPDESDKSSNPEKVFRLPSITKTSSPLFGL